MLQVYTHVTLETLSQVTYINIPRQNPESAKGSPMCLGEEAEKRFPS